MDNEQKNIIVRIIITLILIFFIKALNLDFKLNVILYLSAYLIIGFDVLKKAFLGLFQKDFFDENFLMSVATLGAIILAIYSKSGDFLEAVAVMFFFKIGELFEDIAIDKSRKNIKDLIDTRPDEAFVEKEGKIVQINPNEIEIGSIVLVNPGMKIPVDGIILEGKTNIDTSSLTGESKPYFKKAGDNLLSGSINLSSAIKLKAMKTFENSTASKILDLVENENNKKSTSEKFISKFARIYTPFVCLMALFIAVIVPFVAFLFFGAPLQFDIWIYRALTFLVISCPCALVISIPLSFFAGIGGASKEGILFKGSNYLELLAKVKYFAFDKTGTLTKGVFKVNDIHHCPIEKDELIELAALAECACVHPISKSLKDACRVDIDRNRVRDIEEISGLGIIAFVDNQKIAIGNDKLMEKINVDYIKCNSVATVVHVALEGKYLGHIVISDEIKENAKEAIKKLKELGIKKTFMLTGDKKEIALDVKDKLDIDVAYFELLPKDKADRLDYIMKDNVKTAYVGDGINDAIVLIKADVGISMGTIGTDTAIEASDVVLMKDDLNKLSKAIKISKNCLNIVYQNIIFAITVKFLCLMLGAFGLATMWMAIFADVGVMVIAVLNALRALFVKNLK